jgi:hypothetical protein
MPVAPGNRTAESGPATARKFSGFVTASSHASRSAARLRQGFGVAGRPAQQRLRRRVVPQRAARSLAEDFQMPGMAAV